MTDPEYNVLLSQIKTFVQPFYKDKDIMHDLTHLERIEVALEDLGKVEKLIFNPFITKAALYLHGIIYSHENDIKEFLESISLSPENIDWIIKVAWESQKEHKPESNEGLMLHDAHMLEGGKNFEIIKSLITGSVRGQSLEQTLVYIENNLLNKGQCYTEEGIQRYEIMKSTTLKLFRELNEGLDR